MVDAKLTTKDKLLETATELIWRNSYNSVSVDEICKKAGVLKGSFYHYFPSKAHLAFSTMDKCMQETKCNYDNIFSPERPALERFELMVDHIVEQQIQKRDELGRVCGCPFATLGSEIAAQDEELGNKIADILAKKLTYYEIALNDLAEDGTIDDETNTKLKAEEIFAFVIGQMTLARIKNDLTFLENNLKWALLDLIGVRPNMLKKTA